MDAEEDKRLFDQEESVIMTKFNELGYELLPHSVCKYEEMNQRKEFDSNDKFIAQKNAYF